MSGVLSSVILLLCSIHRNNLAVNGSVINVTTTSLPGDNNVTTTSLPGDNTVTTTSLPGDNNVTTTSLPGDNTVTTTSLPGDNNVTTTSLPGDNNVTRPGKTQKELNINRHVDSTTLVPTDTASSDGACNSTFNCSSDHVDVTTVKDDPSVQWLLSPETYNAINPVIMIINTVLYMLALILNSFNISVFMSHNRCSINCYLIATSLLDILSAVCYSVGIIYIMVTSDDTSLFYSIFGICSGIYFGPVFQRSMNFLVFLVSIERLIVVVYPLKAKEFMLMRRPKSIIMIAVLTTALFHIFSPLRYTVTATTDPTTNATIFSVVPSQLFLQNQAILRGMSTASKVLFVYTLLIGGLILNVLVVCALKHHSKKRQQMATTTDTDKAAKRERQTTITIITSSFVFLFLALPLSTNSIVFNLFPDVYGPNTPNYYVFLLVQSLSTLLSSLSLSTDFVAYFCLSTSFRTTLFRILHVGQADRICKQIN